MFEITRLSARSCSLLGQRGSIFGQAVLDAAQEDEKFILLTADGREEASIGLTLNELAKLMKQLGCVNAMNLDGGGSTVMYINGQVVNRPAVKGGIPLSHTLIVRKDYKLSKI